MASDAAIKQKIPFRQAIGLVCDRAANMQVLDLRKKKGLKIQNLPKVKRELLARHVHATGGFAGKGDGDGWLTRHREHRRQAA